MIGIYIHIPFCSSFCTYCDFYSEIDRERVDIYLAALCKEIENKRLFFEGRSTKLRTIYLGGGTPSILNIDQLTLIFDALNRCYDLSQVEEITIEVNPDDISTDYAKGLISLGINRVSMGVQSFDKNTLDWMNRRHSAEDTEKAFKVLREVGFRNISLDLIFGHSSNMMLLKQDIEKLLTLVPEHVSAYQLSIEESTPLYDMLQGGSFTELSSEYCYKQYSYIQKMFSYAGYEQYEISNFSKPGFRSKHNSAYWDRIPYLGFGASAHSFYCSEHEPYGTRSWNISDVEGYCQYFLSDNQTLLNFSDASLFETKEVLNIENLVDEIVMVGLRNVEGFCIDNLPNSTYSDIVLKNLCGLAKNSLVYCHSAESNFLESFSSETAEFSDKTLLVFDPKNNHLKIPPKKLFISDYIISLLVG